MLRFTIKFAAIGLGVGLMMSATTFLVRAAARQQDTPARVTMLLPNINCLVPCWQGIQLGDNQPPEARDIVASLPQATPQNSEAMWQFSPDGETTHTVKLDLAQTHIYLQPEGIRLGDLMLVYGLPDAIWWVGNYSGIRSMIDLYYPDQKLIIVVWLDHNAHLSPELPVYALSLSARYNAPPTTSRFRDCSYISVFLC